MDMELVHRGKGVPCYGPAISGTYCTYPKRNGQAELTRVAGYILEWFIHAHMVTHPVTNQISNSADVTEDVTNLS